MPHEDSNVVPAEQKLGDYTEDRKRWCQMARLSGLVPAGLKTDAAVFVAIESGMEAGFSPMQALKSVYVINGMPSLTGRGTMALILKADVCKIPPTAAWDGEGDNYGCTITLQRKNQPKPVSVRFTITDAKRGGLWGKKGPWSDYPDQMLQWRAVGRMADFYFADLTAGLGVMEVVRDHNVTVEREKPAEPDPLLVGTGEAVQAAPEVEVVEVDPETGEVIPDSIQPEATQ